MKNRAKQIKLPAQDFDQRQLYSRSIEVVYLIITIQYIKNLN
jgi:hypothetical protein